MVQLMMLLIAPSTSSTRWQLMRQEPGLLIMLLMATPQEVLMQLPQSRQSMKYLLILCLLIHCHLDQW